MRDGGGVSCKEIGVGLRYVRIVGGPVVRPAVGCEAVLGYRVSVIFGQCTFERTMGTLLDVWLHNTPPRRAEDSRFRVELTLRMRRTSGSAHGNRGWREHRVATSLVEIRLKFIPWRHCSLRLCLYEHCGGT